jgi:hypothetical protein
MYLWGLMKVSHCCKLCAKCKCISILNRGRATPKQELEEGNKRYQIEGDALQVDEKATDQHERYLHL